jgi:hypothetical protein
MANEDQLERMTRELIGEVFQTAWALEGVMTTLLEELPPTAFSGGSKVEYLLDAVVETVQPATFAAGEESCRTAIALVCATRDRVRADLQAAVDLMEGGEG